MDESLDRPQEKVFENEQVVNVRRSSGEIEGGWVVKGFNEEDGRYLLLKEDETTGKVMNKHVLASDLASWN